MSEIYDIGKLLARGIWKYRSDRKQKKLYNELIKILDDIPESFFSYIMEYFCKHSKIVKKIYLMEKNEKIKICDIKKSRKKVLKYFWRFSKILSEMRDKIFYNGLDEQLSQFNEILSISINLSDQDFLTSCMSFYHIKEDLIKIDILRKELDGLKIPFEEKLNEKIREYKIKDNDSYKETKQKINEFFEGDIEFNKLFPNGISKSSIYRRITENPKYRLKEK